MVKKTADRKTRGKQATRKSQKKSKNPKTKKHLYDATVSGVMGWASAEYFHIGELSGMRDKDLQYSYALSTANSMAHLNDAMLELIEDPRYAREKPDLVKAHGDVVRALSELMRRYKIDMSVIRRFNTRHVLRI